MNWLFCGSIDFSAQPTHALALFAAIGQVSIIGAAVGWGAKRFLPSDVSIGLLAIISTLIFALMHITENLKDKYKAIRRLGV